MAGGFKGKIFPVNPKERVMYGLPVYGKNLERHIADICRKENLTLVGPNTMGIICPYAGLFATGVHTRPRRGSVAFVSQSGNLGNQLIHWAEQQGIGVSLFVGSGNEAVLSCTDYLEYLESDPHTSIILLYLESVGDGKHFLDVTRRMLHAASQGFWMWQFPRNCLICLLVFPRCLCPKEIGSALSPWVGAGEW
jgi:acyl-CoA synthetase (NDP forming)